MSRVPARHLSLLGALQQLDVCIFLWTAKRKHLAPLARICRGLSRTADGFGYPLLALALWCWGGAAGQQFLVILALAFAIERPLYFILKKGLKRNRPASALPDYQSFIIPSDEFSFPSGHTSGAFAVATALMLFFPQVAPLAFAWAALVGASRVTLGVHFPTDILAGALMGTGVTLLVELWVIA